MKLPCKEIYTISYTPFVMGGSVYQNIKTKVSSFERIPIGKGYYGLIVKNPVKKLWHLAIENCGAIIGTNKSKSKLLKSIMKDVETGDEKIMKEQISKGEIDLKNAKLLSNEDFFSKFSGDYRA